MKNPDYILDDDRDVHILKMCERLEGENLSPEDSALTQLIKTQLKKDWRSDLFVILNKLFKKYNIRQEATDA